MSTLPWGTRFKYGEYEIVGSRENRPRILGEGSFGKTYEAVRTDWVAGEKIEDRVALKVLNPALLNSEAKRFQFIQELKALAQLKHANLIHYNRCGEEGGEVYCAMELCRGGDLSRLAKRFNPLPERVAALIGLQVAAGLRELHQRHRLVHRDIKPTNIMLADEIEPELSARHLAYRFEQQESLCRIVDFGLVNFIQGEDGVAQRFMGSPMFASPEQIREQPIDGRSDIYSLGMTLWYLVQGSGPLLDANGQPIRDIRESMRRHMDPEEHTAAFPSRLSPAFRQILAKMTVKSPEHRFSNAGELQNALRDYLRTVVDEAPAAFAVKRLANPLDTVFDIGEVIQSRSSHRSYQATEKTGGRRVRVNVVANVEGAASSPETDEVAERLRELAELSREPELPSALAPIKDVVWSADWLAYTEDYFPHVAVSDVLKARAKVKRPMAFSEAVVILQPIADALDFLLAHRQDTVSLPCEEIWLTGPGVAAADQNPALLTTALTDWPGLQVRFSMMYARPKQSMEEEGSMAGQTMSGSLHLSADDLHPVPAYARLVYRIVNGSEVAAAVQFAPNAYVPSVALCHASNNLLRDLLCRQRPWTNAGAILKELCANEGVVLRQATSLPVAEVISPGVVRSPYSASNSTQQIPWDLWKPGGEFLCADTERRVTLPLDLPPRNNIVQVPPAQPPAHAASSSVAPTSTGTASASAIRTTTAPVRFQPVTPARSLTPVAPAPTAAVPPPVAPPAQVAPVSPQAPRSGQKFSALLDMARQRPAVVIGAAAAVGLLLAVVAGLALHHGGGAATLPPLAGPIATPVTHPAAEPAEEPVAQPVANINKAKVGPFQAGEKWENTLGMKFVPIPGSQAVIGVWTTRVRDFKAFVEASTYSAEGGMLSLTRDGWQPVGASWSKPGFTQGPEHPVVGVSADDAKAFCRWLTTKEQHEGLIDDNQAYRLPTDEEWSRSAATTTYPWGNAWPPRNASGNFASAETTRNFPALEFIQDYSDGFPGTAPVGSFNANSYGVFDMGGNVRQWCDTPFRKDLNTPEVQKRNPSLEGDSDKPQLVLRGSSCFDSAADLLRVDCRHGAVSSLRSAETGFRCVLGPIVAEPPPMVAANASISTDGPSADAASASQTGSGSSGSANPNEAPANTGITEPGAPANGSAAPGDQASIALDPLLVGGWVGKAAGGKPQKLEVGPDGKYVFTGGFTGSGTIVGTGGSLTQTATGASSSVGLTYKIDGNTLIVTRPDGTSTEFHHQGVTTAAPAGSSSSGSTHHRSSHSGREEQGPSFLGKVKRFFKGEL